jgi:hypothetical protein
MLDIGFIIFSHKKFFTRKEEGKKDKWRGVGTL